MGEGGIGIATHPHIDVQLIKTLDGASERCTETKPVIDWTRKTVDELDGLEGLRGKIHTIDELGEIHVY